MESKKSKLKERPIRPSNNGKYNLDFIDWNNEWERVNEVALKLDRGEQVEDQEEAERIRKHLNIEKEKYGVGVEKFLLVKPDCTKECYICLKYFTKNKKVRKLPCNHQFCEECLKPWIKTNYTCPTCKAKLKKDPDEEENEN